MSVNLTTIDDGIRDTLFNALDAANSDIQWVDNLDDLNEGIGNTPSIQVYWDSLNPVSEGSATDRRTFGGNASVAPMRTQRYIWTVDLYLDPRAIIGQMFAKMLPYVDEVNAVFEAENQGPYFGVTGIKSFTYTATRGQQTYASVVYPTVQWTVEIYVF